jgi:hypothetical protein
MTPSFLRSLFRALTERALAAEDDQQAPPADPPYKIWTPTEPSRAPNFLPHLVIDGDGTAMIQKPGKMNGTPFSGVADVEAVVARAVDHNISILQPGTSGAPDTTEITADMHAICIVPAGPDWPRQWQTVLIENDVVEFFPPRPGQKFDCLVRQAIENRGTWPFDLWVRPDWRNLFETLTAGDFIPETETRKAA